MKKKEAMLRQTLALLATTAALAFTLSAQDSWDPSKTGQFPTTAPQSFSSKLKLSPPSGSPAAKLKITKVEQQVVGGDFVDITSAVTICNQQTGNPTIDFEENVSGETFRITYESDQSFDGDPTVTWSPGGGSGGCPDSTRPASEKHDLSPGSNPSTSSQSPHVDRSPK